MEYKRYRVKSPIKTFRDLEVYRQTTALSAQIFQIALPKSYRSFQKELDILKEISKHVPRLIAESYGDKFASLSVSMDKLERAMRYITDVIAKMDFLVVSIDHEDTKEQFNKLVRSYQIQRVKILNLKRAWVRVWGGGHV